jgi:putative AlgH/UPF0301 family transcriptional regulator
VVLVAPLAEGGHIGFVLNRPTGVKLESLLPDQESARKVVDQVYAGGPALRGCLFALTRRPPAEAGTFVPLLPGLFAAMDGPAVDSLIEKSPNEARYFVARCSGRRKPSRTTSTPARGSCGAPTPTSSCLPMRAACGSR